MSLAEPGRSVSVVTGGSRGIGRGIVEQLASLRHNVVVNYRHDRDSAMETCRRATEAGASSAVAIQADVADPDQGQHLLDGVLGRYGRIDLWVNNAGVAPQERRDVLETSPESWDRVFNTNLRGPFFLTQKVARTMITLRAEQQVQDPQIVFISSISSSFASLNRTEYCVSKAGLSMVVQAFAARLAREGIRVYEIRPGLIETDMTRVVHESYSRRIAEGLTPINRWGTPEDVGRAVAMIASGALAYSTGEVLNIDGGLNLRIL
jgi:NAD(P)-dependent dehydrogenase (short-subunit alcohol dehydrogenase family)